MAESNFEQATERAEGIRKDIPSSAPETKKFG